MGRKGIENASENQQLEESKLIECLEFGLYSVLMRYVF